MRAVMGHQMANFWILVDTSLGSSVPIFIYLHIYATSIHHEAFLDIYVLGIIVLFAF